MPRVAVNKIATDSWFVRFDGTGSEQDVDIFVAQYFYTPSERCASSECRVYEWKDDDGYAQTRIFGEDAEGVGVADAVGPFVDGVVGGGGDNDGVGWL
jgi:hypothetical protein